MRMQIIVAALATTMATARVRAGGHRIAQPGGQEPDRAHDGDGGQGP